MFHNAGSLEGPPGPRRELVLFRRRVQAVILGIALLLSMVFGAAPAFGYWSALGTGRTTATVGTLAAPSDVSATAALSNVSVSWTASAGPLAPTGYYVTRITGGSRTFACGSSPTSPISSTACTDASVPVGTHSYVVDAVHRTWNATSPESSSVTVLSLLELAFTSQPSGSVTAGSVPGLSVQLQTPGAGILVPARPYPLAGVRVVLNLGANSAGGTLAGELTATTDASGVATFGDVQLTKAGTGYTLVASSADYAGAVSTPFDVIAGPATHLAVTSPATATGQASATANVGPFTVERRDEFGNPATGPAVNIALATGTPGNGVFATSAEGPGVLNVGILANASSASFFYGARIAGTTPFTVSGIGAPLVIPVTITAAQPSKLKFASSGPFAKNTSFVVAIQVVDTFDNQTPAEPLVGLQSADHGGCRLLVNQSGAAVTGTALFTIAPPKGVQSNCQLTASSTGLSPGSITFDIK